MNREEIFKLIEDNGLTLHGDIEHFASLVVDTFYAKYLEQPTPQLTGVVSVTMPEPIGYLCENAVGHKYFRWKKPPNTFKPIPLYTAMKNVDTNDTPQERVDKTSEIVHEPVAWVSSEELLVMRGNALGGAKDWRINVGLVKQDGDVGLYTTPPQRKPLTDEEIEKIAKPFWDGHLGYGYADFDSAGFARAIEAAHGIKGLV